MRSEGRKSTQTVSRLISMLSRGEPSIFVSSEGHLCYIGGYLLTLSTYVREGKVALFVCLSVCLSVADDLEDGGLLALQRG